MLDTIFADPVDVIAASCDPVGETFRISESTADVPRVDGRVFS